MVGLVRGKMEAVAVSVSLSSYQKTIFDYRTNFLMSSWHCLRDAEGLSYNTVCPLNFLWKLRRFKAALQHLPQQY